jgi:hypothetical protein
MKLTAARSTASVRPGTVTCTVVPDGPLAFGAHTGRAGPVAAEEVKRDLAQQGQIARRSAMAHPAVLFTEGDVRQTQCPAFSIDQRTRIAAPAAPVLLRDLTETL